MFKFYTTDKTVALVFEDTKKVWQMACQMLQLEQPRRVLFFSDEEVTDEEAKEILDRIHADGIETEEPIRHNGVSWENPNEGG